MANRYKLFMRLCEKWPLESTKIGRDFGAVIRNKVAETFKQGEVTLIQDPAKCDKMYNSLNKINNNYYKNLYSTKTQIQTCSGLDAEQCKMMLSNEAQEFIKSKQ